MTAVIRHSPDSTRRVTRSMVRPSPRTPAIRGTGTVVSMHDVAGWIRPWVTKDRRDTLDSLAMDARDRTANLGFFAAAGIAWLLVGIVVAVLIVLRVQGLLELPIALFMIALAVVAEVTLSAER